jgi:serine/threonine-protein kinase
MVGNTSDEPKSRDSGLVGRVLAGRYRIVDVLSTGANTVIADALDMESTRPVTFKIVRSELSASDEFRREFRKRADVTTALTHPNIAAVLDWGEVEINGESTVFWVVEHLSGGSLRDLLDRGRLLEPSQALVVGLEACRALDAAHQRGIAHTELTPSKLVFGADRRLRIVDFGMAELMGREAWSEPATVATHVARYSSPEQALGLEVGPKTDVYALALSLLEAVTGNVPFAAESTVATLAARVGKLMPVSADLGSLASVLERAGRPDADDRSTAAEFGRSLVQAAETLPRPEPIPIVASGLFDTSEMGRGIDPDAPDGAATGLASAGAAVAAGVVAAGEPEADPIDVATSIVDETDRAGIDADPGNDDPSTDAAVDLPDADPAVDAEPEVTSSGTESVDGGPDTEALPPSGVSPAAIDQNDDALIILTDVADPPTGSLQVANGGATEGAPSRDAESGAATRVIDPPVDAAPAATAQMPVTVPAAVPPSGELYDEERPRRRTGVIFMLSLLVLVGLAAVAFAAFYLLRTKSYEVPELAGVNKDVALNEIAGNDWVVSIERERSDVEPDADEVIRTFPSAGAVLEEGDPFTLYVSEGPLFRELPDITGASTEDAQATLAALQLLSSVEAEAFDEVAPIGVVLSWRVIGDESRVAGDEVLPGTNIAFTVSKGPAPRAVPDVRGLTLEDAQAAANAVQLSVVAGEDAFSDDVPVGIIISQDVAPATELPRDGSFTVVRSKGLDLITLPALEGLSYTEAQQALTDAGFTIGSLLGTTEGTFESISIAAEPIGEQYRRGTSVDLIFL